MKTRPITPATIHVEPGAPPYSTTYRDIYHPRIGALAQAQHVFIQGSGLPARWAARPCFAILEAGFGLGNNFLATLQAWRADPARGQRLVYLAIERHPPTREDLVRVHTGSALQPLADALIAQWPPAVPGLHLLNFEAGQVQLMLAWGDIVQMLPQLRGSIDAFYLDGFAPSHNPEMWQQRVLKGIARLAAPGATVATWSAAKGLRDELTAVGFVWRAAAGVGGKREITLADFAPRFEVRRRAPNGVTAAPSSALVIGAGLAGASVADALARRGVAVTVLDRHAEPAAEASGNIAGIYHATVHPQDGPHARLLRAAALYAHARYAALIDAGLVPGQAGGLLRLQPGDEALQAMHTLAQQQGLAADFAQALSAKEASQRAGVPLKHAAWHFKAAGWLAPGALVRHLLRSAGVQFRGGVAVQTIQHDGQQWQALDATGRLMACAPALVLADGGGDSAWLAGLGLAPWPVQRWRGQVSVFAFDQARAPKLRLPLAGLGYALPLDTHHVLCGASSASAESDVQPDAKPRASDHDFNAQRLLQLCGLRASSQAAQRRGRVGWRVHSNDRQAIAGPLPAVMLPSARTPDQPRFVPRMPGLFALAALGGRGITLAPLLAELLAAQVCGEPLPLEADLVDAVDPARWLVKTSRQHAQQPQDID
jgi:tRNA 5-methylaminomethyl-2-thiouridine biosynthesis bifunctional protein